MPRACVWLANGLARARRNRLIARPARELQTPKMEQEAYRHVPYDIDVEQALLGAILVDNRAIERISTLIRPDHFYDPLHGRIYETMSQMIERGGVVVTPLTLHATMKSDPGVIETGGQAYFDALRSAAPAIPNVEDYADILADLAVRRSLIRIGEDIVNTAYDAPTEKSSKDQIAEAEKALYAVAESNKYGEGAMDFHEALRRTVRGRRTRRGAAADFRRHLRLHRHRQFVGRAAAVRPSDPGRASRHGQDGAGHQHGVSLRQGLSAGYRKRRGISARRAGAVLQPGNGGAAILSPYSVRAGRAGNVEDPQRQIQRKRMGEIRPVSMQDLSNLPLYIDDTGGISIAQDRGPRPPSEARKEDRADRDRLSAAGGAFAPRHDNRVQEITEVTKGLKNPGQGELNVPVLALSQLSRGVDARDDKRPVLSDLRRSGSIEQDADVVMFVFREEYYLKSREPEPGTAPNSCQMDGKDELERATNRAEVLVEKAPPRRHPHHRAGVRGHVYPLQQHGE